MLQKVYLIMNQSLDLFIVLLVCLGINQLYLRKLQKVVLVYNILYLIKYQIVKVYKIVKHKEHGLIIVRNVMLDILGFGMMVLKLQIILVVFKTILNFVQLLKKIKVVQNVKYVKKVMNNYLKDFVRKYKYHFVVMIIIYFKKNILFKWVIYHQVEII